MKRRTRERHERAALEILHDRAQIHRVGHDGRVRGELQRHGIDRVQEGRGEAAPAGALQRGQDALAARAEGHGAGRVMLGHRWPPTISAAVKREVRRGIAQQSLECRFAR